jgi:hypothetical protein
MVRSRFAGVAAFGVLLSSHAARADPESSEPVRADAPATDEYADTDPSALTDFREALDPHGAWENDPSYGTVWTPNADEVGSDFEPYASAGHWDYLDGDYSWVSEYEWGWVCFHYGRWVLSGGRWLWIAGHTFAAAWVTWRLADSGDPYVGWAPMAPSWVWVGGEAFAMAFPAWEPWAFAANGDLLGPGLATRVVVGQRAAPLLARSHAYVRTAPARSAVFPFVAVVPHGPPPALLGIASHLPSPSPTPGEARARLFARPSTAQALGARTPAPHAAPRVRYGVAPGAPRAVAPPVRHAPDRGHR